MRKFDKVWNKIKKYKTLPKDLEKKVTELKKVCFPWEEKMSEKEKITHYDRFCSKGEILRYILALENNNLIGLAIALKRDIAFRNKRVILGGIGGVCVRPEKRRKGVATSLIDEAIEELKKTSCDIAYLCTDVKDEGTIKLYTQFGFIPLNRPHTYLGKSGKKYIDTDGMIAPVNSANIFQEVEKDKNPFDIGVGNW